MHAFEIFALASTGLHSSKLHKRNDLAYLAECLHSLLRHLERGFGEDSNGAGTQVDKIQRIIPKAIISVIP